MKNKLKPLVLGLVLLLSIFNIYANYPVIDISAIMTAVNQLYTMYDEVDSMITQVQQGYEQLQRAVEAAKNWEMDWSNWTVLLTLLLPVLHGRALISVGNFLEL